MTKKTPLTIPVKRRALIARIERHFLKEGKGRELRSIRGGFYLIDTRKGEAIDQIELEKFGHDLGVLEPWESLAAE